MKQAEIKLLEPFFELFKENVDLKLVANNKIVASLNGRTITFSLSQEFPGNKINIASPETPTGLPTGILSLDQHPTGSFDFEIRYEDGEKANWDYHNNFGCPFFQATRRSFPNFRFESVGRMGIYEGRTVITKQLALISGFSESNMKEIRATKQPLKTTITFL